MAFCVNVPVLSVQMTEVHPSVSTAERRLTSAFRRAIRWTPIARERVTVGSSPSGTKATIIPRAKRNPSPGFIPAARTERPKMITPTPTAIAETTRVTRSISRWRGLFSLPRSSVNPAILPNSVAIPVANTTATPFPAATVVPANTRFGNSQRESPDPVTASRVFRTGWDSPVRVDWSIRSSVSAITRASAETWSPSERRRMSPGTSSSAGICASPPPLRTRACRGRIRRSASAAFSALCSCQKPNAPLMRFTTSTATPIWGIPARNAIPPPTHSRVAMRWVNWERSFR